MRNIAQADVMFTAGGMAAAGRPVPGLACLRLVVLPDAAAV